MGDPFKTPQGPLTVHPVQHASLVLDTPRGVVYADPVGDPALFDGLPPADLILVTHEHGDHFNVDTLKALTAKATKLITNPSVYGKLPADLQAQAEAIANGDGAVWSGTGIDAVPAYNTTKDRLNFHPKGRDNGYVLNFTGFRIYISGDTEDTPEMRRLRDIELCFLCMNLPYTMSPQQAAEAVKVFRPKVVYPYHYRNKDGSKDNPQRFAQLVGDAADVRLHDWYAKGNA